MTNNTVTVNVGSILQVIYPVNPVTNKIYVANSCGNGPSAPAFCNTAGTVTVIDGATNNTLTVAAGNFPFGIALNPVTNKVYGTNDGDGTVTVIDGATNNTATVAVRN